jgi:hypothetical protein
MSEFTHTVRTVKVRTRRTVKRGDRVKTEERVRVKRKETRTKRTARGKPQGVVLYRGPSLLNGRPIVCVATNLRRKSKNGKTGGVIQTYVLADGVKPTDAIKSGGDESICGNCPHRPRDGFGTCYVNAGRGPNAVYKALRLGTYPKFNVKRHLQMFAGKVIRLGAYGDPAAVPFEVWEAVCSVAKTWVGYTHQWRTCDPRLARYCMASVETANQAREAWSKGWRTFRIRTVEEPILAGEFVCPASAEAGKRLTCAQCKACSGAKTGQNASPVILVHGSANKVAHYYRRVLLDIRAQEMEEAARGRLSLEVLDERRLT